MSLNFGIEALITLLIGIIICYFGYKCKRITVCLVWFCIGAYFTYTALTGTINDQMLLYFISGGVGLLCGAVGYGLELISVFISVGFMAGYFAYGYLPFTQIPNIIVAVIIGIVVGLLATKFIKPIFIITTGISGAQMIITGLTSLVIGIPSTFVLIIEIILIVSGILFQFSDCRNLD